MAFGLKREEVKRWKEDVENGRVAILTHYWLDDRFPNSTSVTKVGCSHIEKLISWGEQYNLDPKWIHYDGKYPHFDLFGEKQLEILQKEGKWEQIKRFNL
ncbi:hypothetical protein [Ornithinibacillus halotolerans]|uniref:YneQ n=1 Tax=Ornithinibacillus halotolerans TaxID=1274357 RepID=A0A916W2I2_9BACI|nr:hypothetical protein [Ornithinibacillus halotolerans]GGA62185.1 hypothetical protein GCM10008025_02670 [Ornithinibacillus halotolerans]